MNKEAVIIFPHQLFKDHPALTQTGDTKKHVYLVEHPRFFTDFAFHKKKLILHRASMKAYASFLKKKKHKVTYLEFKQASKLLALLKKNKTNTIHCCDLVDLPLEKKIKQESKKKKISIEWHETPMFLSPIDWLKKMLGKKKRYSMASFYTAQRKRLDILVKNGKPVGGKWSFDDQNRKTLPEKTKVPKAYKARPNDFVKEAIDYVDKHFKNNPGSSDNFFYPVTFAQAQQSFNHFLKYRFKHFGDYQDAMHIKHPYLFHSLLTPALNIGLITPKEVVNKALTEAKKQKIKINNTEGFIRQVIGWREFIRGVYLLAGNKQRKGNFFSHRKKMAYSFWTAETEIAPINHVIKKVLETGYAHHIERLMILGNFMLLSNFHPTEVYKWFMELFIDSYDWVMVPNVYGMAQYADGGLMTTKPYVSSSKYVLKMSNYKKGDWCDIWDALYWYFIYSHKKVIAKNARLAIMLAYLKRMKPETLQKHLVTAKKFLGKK